MPISFLPYAVAVLQGLAGGVYAYHGEWQAGDCLGGAVCE